MKATLHHNKTQLGLLLANILFLVVWTTLQFIDDVYAQPWVGAIFELVWLPVIALVFFAAIISLFFAIKQKLSLRSAYVYLFLLSLILIYLLIR
jgi:hypothetical protein